MNLYTCYSQSHADMFYRYMAPSLKGRFTILGKTFPQICLSGVYRTTGWPAAMAEKISMLMDAARVEKQIFVYSDVDVVFDDFGPEDVVLDMADADFACANDGGYGQYCTGFMFIRPCPEVVDLLGSALKLVEKHGCDEPALNEAIPKASLKTRLLPLPKYTNYGHIAGGGLDGVDRLRNLPDAAQVFHANYIIGIEQKEELLSAAKSAFDNRPCNYSATSVKQPL